jgi:CheY-like chemotaxis protein
VDSVRGTIATSRRIAERAMKKPETKKAEQQARGERGKGPTAKKPVTVLHVDDDPNDTTLLQVACAKAAVDFELQNVEDSDQVIDYLSGTGKYADRNLYRLPGLVLLDLKMPKATGLEVLKWIRNNSLLKHLPVIVLSGSELQEDMHQAYAVGANSYLVKPPNFDSLVNLVKSIGEQLPLAPKPHGGASRSCI